MAAASGAIARGWSYAQERWYLRALVGAAIVSLLLTLAIVWIDYAGSRTDQRVALTFLINLVAVIGIQVFMGNSGVSTFGHVGFVAIGAYTAALVATPTERKSATSLIPDAPSFILNAQFGFLPSLIAGVVVAALIGALAGVVIVRLRGGSAAIATLALLIIIRTVIGNWRDITRGPQTWSGIPEHTTIWLALLMAIVAIFVARVFRESSVGLRLRATRTDELASSAVGVSIARERFAAWVLASAIAGAAGVLWAFYFLSLAPQDFFFTLTFLYLTMVIIGGPSVSGAVVGAAAITLVTEFVRRTETGGIDFVLFQFDQVFGLTQIVLGLLVLITVILRPKGILGRWELDELFARAARRFWPWRARTTETAFAGAPTAGNSASGTSVPGRRGQESSPKTELSTSGRESSETTNTSGVKSTSRSRPSSAGTKTTESNDEGEAR
jgi:branched-chain amino acid transport system permease protein